MGITRFCMRCQTLRLLRSVNIRSKNSCDIRFKSQISKMTTEPTDPRLPTPPNTSINNDMGNNW